MGTKLKPGKYDCYEKAAPNEPIFTLRAKDRDASMVVKLWAFFRLQQIDAGLRPESDRQQVSEALHCATEMEIWHREYLVQDQMLSLEFQDGVPLTGQHAKKVRNTTSGVGDI